LARAWPGVRAPSVEDMKTIGVAVLWVLGIYLIGRAIVEPFVIDMNDPSTYHLDWGGPHLAGVLAVHCGPGIVAAALMIRSLSRRRRAAVSA
jgi:hypothetical protein